MSTSVFRSGSAPAAGRRAGQLTQLKPSQGRSRSRRQEGRSSSSAARLFIPVTCPRLEDFVLRALETSPACCDGLRPDDLPLCDGDRCLRSPADTRALTPPLPSSPPFVTNTSCRLRLQAAPQSFPRGGETATLSFLKHHIVSRQGIILRIALPGCRMH